MVFLDKLPVLTSRSLLQYIQSDAVKSCAGWFINKCQDNFLGDPKFSKQLEQMSKLDKELEQIQQETINKIKVKPDWEHLHTRMFHAERGICHKFQLMQTILKIENCTERRNEAILLSNDVLETKSGVLNNLSVIHQVLVGRHALNTFQKGLLDIWSNEIYSNMKINRISSKIYQDYLDKYLTQAAIVQFKGILLFTGSTVNTKWCLHQFNVFENNLKSQIETMQNTVPTFMKYLSNPDKKNVFILQPVFDGKDQPFVKRLGPNKRLANDYLCGIPKAGKWIFKASPDFDQDGSLLISGSSKEKYGQYYYMGVSARNKAVCVAGKHRATPFYVIPVNYRDTNIRILVCKSNSEHAGKLFLGNKLEFDDEHGYIEFTLSFDIG